MNSADGVRLNTETRKFGLTILVALFVFGGLALGFVWVRSFYLNHALKEALDEDEPEKMGRLLAQGANPNAFGGDLLIRAVGPRWEVGRVLLADPRIRLDVRDPDGETPLTLAVNSELSYAVDDLVRTQRRLRQEMRDPRDRLLYAAAAGDVDQVRQLLDMGVPVDWDQLGYPPPLYVATLMDQKEVVRLLLERGADVNHRYRADAQVPKGMTALDLALTVRHGDLAHYLLRSGAKVDGATVSYDILAYLTGFHPELHLELIQAFVTAPGFSGVSRVEAQELIRTAQKQGRMRVADLLKQKLPIRNARGGSR